MSCEIIDRGSFICERNPLRLPPAVVCAHCGLVVELEGPDSRPKMRAHKDQSGAECWGSRKSAYLLKPRLQHGADRG